MATDDSRGDVAASNAAMAEAWDGATGASWAAQADRFDRSARLYQPHLIEAAGIGTSDRVVDVGCGAGQLSLDCAARAPSGWVTGVDLSGRLLEVARARAAEQGVGNVEFLHVDAQQHEFAAASYDLVVSRSGTMFFGDPVAAFTNLGRALRPGGRLVMMVWQGLARSDWIRTIFEPLAAGRDLGWPPEDGQSPLGLSRPERVREIFAAAGFADVALDEVAEPVDFGSDADAATDFVLGLQGGMLEELDAATRAGAIDNLRSALAAHETPEGVLLGAATWFVTATRP